MIRYARCPCPAGLSFRFTRPQEVEITRPAGFDAGAIYELIYTAKEPLVLGLGFAAFRDVASFLRRETSNNPLGQPATRAYGCRRPRHRRHCG